ncbi:hypothetical protein CASFOL_030795 [Castilleja foliolosa]|uniref:RING-type domain-containing protein n=1 Tax=Castilleja foliolosa TaxID=1961234 RepID=A0ABD3C6C6_9LAMI
MGSKLGYAYDFQLAMVGADEINSKYKSKPRDDGLKTFLFEFRTNFILKKRPENLEEEDEAAEVIIDSERFDGFITPSGDELRDCVRLSFMARYRLKEYWMTEDEIKFLLNKTLDFTRNIASDPQYVSLNPIPVVVCLEVKTVQQEGEPFNDALDRAIRAEHLVPLYNWSVATTVECSSMPKERRLFLIFLKRVRVENVEEGMALMPVCPICSRSGAIGSQISTLPRCGHAFHSHCIARWIEENDVPIKVSVNRNAPVPKSGYHPSKFIYDPEIGKEDLLEKGAAISCAVESLATKGSDYSLQSRATFFFGPSGKTMTLHEDNPNATHITHIATF